MTHELTLPAGEIAARLGYDQMELTISCMAWDPPRQRSRTKAAGSKRMRANVNLRIRRRMKSVAPPMPPNSDTSAVRMRWWADEFDRLREHGRVIRMSA